MDRLREQTQNRKCTVFDSSAHLERGSESSNYYLQKQWNEKKICRLREEDRGSSEEGVTLITSHVTSQGIQGRCSNRNIREDAID